MTFACALFVCGDSEKLIGFGGDSVNSVYHTQQSADRYVDSTDTSKKLITSSTP